MILNNITAHQKCPILRDGEEELFIPLILVPPWLEVAPVGTNYMVLLACPTGELSTLQPQKDQRKKK